MMTDEEKHEAKMAEAENNIREQLIHPIDDEERDGITLYQALILSAVQGTARPPAYYKRGHDEEQRDQVDDYNTDQAAQVAAHAIRIADAVVAAMARNELPAQPGE